MALASFSDVPPGHWAYDAVDYMESEGFITGYPDGTFQGNAELSRYEFAIVISRLYSQFLDRIEEVDESPSPPIETEAVLEMLMEEFESDLDNLRSLVVDNISRIETLEDTVETLPDSVDEVSAQVDNMDARFHPFGDLRLRFEGKYPEEDLQTQRARYRLRWGFTSRITDEITFGTRFATGSEGGITSTNRSIEDAFGFDQITIDRAYITWQPVDTGFTFYGGKFAPPWKTTPLVWDSDAMVEGIAQRYQSDNFNFYLGELVPAKEGFYLVAQAGVDDVLMEGLDLYLTYHYMNDTCWDRISGMMVDGDLKSRYDFDRIDDSDTYDAIEAYGVYSFDAGNIPLKIEGNYYRNLVGDALESEESGLQQAAWVRLSVFGKPRNIGDWRLRGEWGKAQANSVLSWLTDADRGSGDHEWYAFNWTYRLMRNTDLGITWINRDRLSSSGHRTDIVQVDVSTKF